MSGVCVCVCVCVTGGWGCQLRLLTFLPQEVALWAPTDIIEEGTQLLTGHETNGQNILAKALVALESP